MDKFTIKFTKITQKDYRILQKSEYREKTDDIFNMLAENPHRTTYPFEKLANTGENRFSVRINQQHRIVYKIKENNVIEILSCWTHCHG